MQNFYSDSSKFMGTTSTFIFEIISSVRERSWRLGVANHLYWYYWEEPEVEKLFSRGVDVKMDYWRWENHWKYNCKGSLLWRRKHSVSLLKELHRRIRTYRGKYRGWGHFYSRANPIIWRRDLQGSLGYF